MTKLSLRRLWVLYKQVAMAHCSHTRREMMLLQEAFYSGAHQVDLTTEITYEDGRKARLNSTIAIDDVADVPQPAREPAYA